MKTFEKLFYILTIFALFAGAARAEDDAQPEFSYWGDKSVEPVQTSPFDTHESSGVFGVEAHAWQGGAGNWENTPDPETPEGQEKKIFPWSREDFLGKVHFLPSVKPESSIYSSIPMNELIPALDQKSHRMGEMGAKSFDRVFLWENEILDSPVQVEASMNFGWSVKPDLQKRAKRSFGNKRGNGGP